MVLARRVYRKQRDAGGATSGHGRRLGRSPAEDAQAIWVAENLTEDAFHKGAIFRACKERCDVEISAEIEDQRITIHFDGVDGQNVLIEFAGTPAAQRTAYLRPSLAYTGLC